MSFSLAGLGWPSIQNRFSSSVLIGTAPHVCDTACTPGVARSWSSRARKAVRIAGGGRGHHRGRKRQPKAENMVRIKARIHVPKMRQAADHQARANQQNQRQSQFNYHEYVLGTVTRSTRSTATPVQGLVQVRLRKFERRRQAEQNSREQ